jgi:hypothetical protein
VLAVVGAVATLSGCMTVAGGLIGAGVGIATGYPVSGTLIGTGVGMAIDAAPRDSGLSPPTASARTQWSADESVKLDPGSFEGPPGADSSFRIYPHEQGGSHGDGDVDLKGTETFGQRNEPSGRPARR